MQDREEMVEMGKGRKAGRNAVKRQDKKPAGYKPKKPASLVQGNPKLAVIVLVATYFLIDYLMVEKGEGLGTAWTAIFTMLAPSILYSYYVNDYQRGIYPAGGTDIPGFVRDKRKYAIAGWLAICACGILFLVAGPFLVPRFFPVVDNTYYRSQVMLMVFIAPVMEEVIFRYLLYDRWLRRKWGWFWGFLASSFVFVVCHPVTDIHSLVIYWAPTVLFFLVYHEFGLYGSIVMHMVYNMMAI